ncbi:MAG: DUF6178 family protein [Thermodesulfobacteriota bacterium]|nr:DUF6178 family protein [Thermodesulfobacteriota bacterium]
MASEGKNTSPALIDRGALVSDLSTLSGGEILKRILECDTPQEAVQDMALMDFHWLVKKVGEDDCLPLLRLASVDQWQYLLDLEIWTRDRLNDVHLSVWIKRLIQADSRRLVRWLFGDGQALAYYYFFKAIEVITTTEDEAYDLPAGFFTLDGFLHLRVVDPEYKDSLEDIIRTMASEDFDRYQALFLGLAGILPTEFEEDMYRLKNVRLAEHGFLPFEEAVSVYAPLGPEALRIEEPPALPDMLVDAGDAAIVPVSPLHLAGTDNLLTEVVSKAIDTSFLDRIRLEFAGLCNQIVSADGLPVCELDVLINACQKAARHLNLAIERLCGRDILSAELLLKNNSLVSIFRVGFGLVLKLKWEAEQWVKGSWFRSQGLDTSFWGELWGGTLSGLLKSKPRHYMVPRGAEEYRDFEWLSDLGECLKILRRLIVLDSLLERLAALYTVDNGWIQSKDLTFHPILFDLWACRLLNLELRCSGIPLAEAKNFFRLLRAGKKNPPYHMPGFEKAFVRDFVAYTPNSDPEVASILEETLALVWRDFQEEHKRISLKDLDSRFTKFISILPG